MSLVLLGGQRLLDQRQRASSGSLQGLDALTAQLVILAEQLERSHRVVQLTAHPVVADHVLGIGRHGDAQPVTGSTPLPSRTMKTLSAGT
jgi:hypothetical protein